jgi:polysaccharide pyruvyl transferase WcaK-like protein
MIMELRNKMSTAVIFGSIGVNRGDDLMGRVLANLCKQVGHVPVIAAIDPEYIKNSYGEITFPSSLMRLHKWIRHIASADVVIVGGGTMIQNDFGRTGVSGILLYAAVAVCLSKYLFRKRTLVLGIGINEVTTINRMLAKMVLTADEIFVRDVISEENAKKISSNVKVRKLFDIALCTSLYDQRSGSTVRMPPTRPYVCVAVAKERNGDLACRIAEETIRFAISNGLLVKLVAMDVRESEELGIYRTLKSQYKDAVEIVVPDDPYIVIDVVKSATICVGMRLHFCVICLISGVSPIVVSREQKTQWLARFTGLDRFLKHDDPDAISKLTQLLRMNANRSLDTNVVSDLDVVDKEILKELTSVIKNDQRR